jgi:hypothetical protein
VTRAALLAWAVLPSLAFAGSALASYSPKIIVSGNPHTGAGPFVNVNVKVAAADAPTARVIIYLPSGYRLGSPTAGTKLGSVSATAAAGDLGGAVLPLKGDLVVVDPAAFTAAQKQNEQLCLGTATPSQVWTMHLSAAGQVLDVPLYVLGSDASEQAFSDTKLQICLPPPDVPVGTPGRAAFGAKLLSASFTSSAITNPVAGGEYRWRTLWTPYTPAKGTANMAGSVEAQGLVRIPGQITQKITSRKRTKTVKGKAHTSWLVTVTGRVTEHGAPIPALRVTVVSGTTKSKLSRLGSVKTNANGVYVKKGVVSTPHWFQSGVGLPLRDLGTAGCTQTFAPVPCVDATVGAYHLVSPFARSRG